jgi:hypothetical protein
MKNTKITINKKEANMRKRWKPQFNKGTTYIDKKTNLRYFICGIHAQVGGISVVILHEGETFNKENEGYKVQPHRGMGQPYLRTLKLVETNEPKLVHLNFMEFHRKYGRLAEPNEIIWENA